MNWTVVTYALISAVLGPGPSLGGESSLMARVLSEYPRALSKMESFFDRVHGSGRRIDSILTEGSKDKPPRWRTEVQRSEFAFGDRGKKLVTVSAESDTERRGSYEYVTCTSPRYSFRLRRDSEHDPLLVVAMGPGGDPGIERTLDHFSRQYLEAPLTGIMSMHISKMMARPDFAFTIKGVTQFERAGRRLLKIDFAFTVPMKKTAQPISGWLLVDPDRHWATQEYEFRNDRNPNPVLTGKFEYGSSVDGIPLPRVVSTSDHYHRYRFEFDEIIPGPVPEDEFTLAAFGLPEIGRPARNRYAGGMSLWLIGIAIITGVLAVALRYLSVRASRKVT